MTAVVDLVRRWTGVDVLERRVRTLEAELRAVQLAARPQPATFTDEERRNAVGRMFDRMDRGC